MHARKHALVVPCARYRRSRGYDVRASLFSFFLTALACSAAPERTARLPAPPRSPQPPVVWSRFAEVRRWPAVGKPFENAGHAGAGSLAIVRVSPEARSAYEHLVRDSELAEGTVVALFHELAPGRPGPIYVMTKSAGGWLFETYRADGTKPAEPARGTADTCRRCHADGVADFLFGLPRGALR